MAGFLTLWASGLVVAVIIGSLIEMILPESNNKKYVKTIIGIFILFTIISPIIVKFSNGVDLKSIINYDEYSKSSEVSAINVIKDEDVFVLYRQNLKKQISITLEKLDYKVKDISLNVSSKENTYGEIENVKLVVTKTNEKDNKSKINSINIAKVEINLNNSEKEENVIVDKSIDADEIRNTIFTTYNIPKDKIFIN